MYKIGKCLTFQTMLIFVARVNVWAQKDYDSNKTLHKREISIYQCSDKFCNYRGNCVLDSRGKPSCQCYQQYSSGRTCEKGVNNCIGFQLEPCDSKHTKSCISFYGSRICKCAENYGGETCQQHEKDIGLVQMYMGLYFKLQPKVNSPTEILFVTVGYWQPDTVPPIICEVEGKQIEITRAKLTSLSPQQNITSVISKVANFPEEAYFGHDVANRSYFKYKHTFLHAKKTFAYIFVNIKTAPKKKTDIKVVELPKEVRYHYKFQYQSKNMGGCVPDIQFEGFCSQRSNWAPQLLMNTEYKVYLVIKQACPDFTKLENTKIRYNNTLRLDYYQLDLTKESNLKELPKKFKFSPNSIGAKVGSYFVLLAEVYESPKNQKIPSKGFVGKDVCWFGIHNYKKCIVVPDTLGLWIGYADSIANVHLDVYTYEKFEKPDTTTAYTYTWLIFQENSKKWINVPKKPHDKMYAHTLTQKINVTHIAVDVCTKDGGNQLCVRQQIWLVPKIIRPPTLRAKCIRNCGFGLEEYSEGFPVDYNEHMHVHFHCLYFCGIALAEQNQDYYMHDMDLVSHWTTEKDYDIDLLLNKWFHIKFLPNRIMSHPSFLVQHFLSYVHMGSIISKFYYRVWVRHEGVNHKTECLNRQTIIDVMEMDATICLKDINVEKPVKFRFYQQVVNSRNTGVMFARGHLPYANDVLLAASNIGSAIYIEYIYQLTGALIRIPYDEIKLDIRTPSVRLGDTSVHIGAIKDVYNGKWGNHGSVKFHIEHNEFSQLVQKLHFIMIEIASKGVSRITDVNVQHTKIVENMLMESFENMKNKLVFEMADDIVQVASLNTAYLKMKLPDIQNTRLFSGELIGLMSAELHKLFENDPVYKNRPLRTFDFCSTLLQDIDQLLHTYNNAHDVLAVTDYKSKLIEKLTELLLTPSLDEQVWITDYPLYETEEDEDPLKVDQYKKVSKILEISIVNLVNVINIAGKPIETVDRSYQSSSIIANWAEEYNKKPIETPVKYFQPVMDIVNSDGFVVWVKTGTRTYFNTYFHGHIFKTDYGILLSFKDAWNDVARRTSVNAADVIEVQVCLLSSNLYWWKKYPENILSFIMYLHVTINSKVGSYFTYLYETARYLPKIYVPATAQSVSHSDDSSLITTFFGLVKNTSARVLVVQFKSNLNHSLQVLIQEGTKPTFSDFSKGDMKHVGKKAQRVTQRLSDGSLEGPISIYISLIPSSEKAYVDFALTVYVIECLHWVDIQENDQMNNTNSFSRAQPLAAEDSDLLTKKNSSLDTAKWDSSNCEKMTMAEKVYHNDPDTVDCYCQTTQDSNFFSVASEIISLVLQGVMKVDVDFNPKMSLWVPTTVGLLAIFFGALYAIGMKYDKQEQDLVKPLLCIDIRKHERYLYVLVIQTGSKYDSGTTSNIAFKLYGVYGNSARHVLRGVCKPPKMFSKRGIDFYALTTKETLGAIRAVEVWIDHRGWSPQWYCEKFIVRDYNVMLEWVFMVQHWFSLIEDSPAIRRTLYQTIKPEPPTYAKILEKDDFAVHHIWFGMLTREHCHALKRSIKVVIASSTLLLGSAIAMFYIGVAELIDEVEPDYGEVRMTEAFIAAIIGLFFSVSFHYPILYGFRNTQPCSQFTYYFEDFSGMDPTALRPLYTKDYSNLKALWTALGISLVFSFCFMMFFGITFGERKSYMLLLAMFYILIMDAIFVQTFLMICRNILYRVQIGAQDTERICNLMIDLDLEEQLGMANNFNRKHTLKKDMYSPVPRILRQALMFRERKYHEYRYLIKDLILYCWFLVVVVYLCHQLRNPYTYEIFYSLKALFMDGYNLFYGFSAIRSHEDFIDYLNHTFIHIVHAHDPGWLIIPFYKLIGVVRLRQIRISDWKDDCLSAFEFGNAFDRCYNDIEEWNQETDDFSPYWKRQNITYLETRTAIPFYHTEPEESISPVIYTRTGSYPGGGFIALLGRHKLNSRSSINKLVSMHWFDKRTRLVAVEFTIYSPHANIFSTVQLFYLRTAKDIRTDYRITPTMLFHTKFIYLLRQYLVNFLFCLGATIITLHLIRKMMHTVGWWKDFWLYFSLQISIQSFICSSMTLYRAFFVQTKINLIEQSAPTVFVSFFDFVDYDRIITIFYATLSFLVTSRLVKQCRFFANVYLFETTIAYSVGPMITFTTMFFILLFATSVALNGLLGTTNINFFTHFDSILALVSYFVNTHGITDSKSYETIYQGGRLCFFIYFMFFMSYKLLVFTVYSVILMVAFKKAKDAFNVDRYKFPLRDYFRERWFHNMRKEEVWRRTVLRRGLVALTSPPE